MAGSLRIIHTPAPLLLQDRGRPGLAGVGVTASGAFDDASAALAQRLVGNPESQAALEITMGGVALRTDRTVSAVVTGALVDIRVAGVGVAVHEVFSWPAGSDLVLGTPIAGLRNYLAVRGGLACDLVLGSASHDVLSGLGPTPLDAGDSVHLAGRPAGQPLLSHVPVAASDPGVLRVRLGPRTDWFRPDAVRTLLGQPFTVSPHSNRIGVRLLGPELMRSVSAELPSEPLQRGAVQVPASGQPIVMGPDHPTTGGYPVIAAVVAADWHKLGQLRPGDQVRFVLDRP